MASEQDTTLQRQLRSVGIVLLSCGEHGNILSRPSQGKDWLAEFLCGSPMFRNALKESTRRWSGCSDPEPIEAMPGLWLCPFPLVSRRRLEGYTVAVIVSEQLMNSEHLSAMCQAGNHDLTLIRSMLLKLPPASEADVPRLTMLVRHVQESNNLVAANSAAVESTGQQLAESYEEISLLYTIIQSMTVVQQPDRFVTIACQELLDTLPYAWIAASLANDRHRLKGLANRIIVAGQPRIRLPQLHALANDLMEEAVGDSPMVLQTENRPEHRRYAELGSTVLVHPVCSDGHVVGLLIAGDKQGPDPAASSVDIKLLGATATHMAIFLENAALYDDLNKMFIGTLEALTASIDAKDRYTCGHSQRVAHLTQQIAIAAGLDDAVVKRMHIAGLVHDVGKIGVPESVLLKPGKLTHDEFDWIRKHPEMGYRILKDIPQLKDILPGVLYHHERWDGCGYPKGLAGEEIPQVARLIGLADAFDAMSSTRTYRSAMGRPQVLKEIERCAGKQFDPELVPLFVNLDFSEYDRLVAEHQAGDFSSALSHHGRGRAA